MISNAFLAGELGDLFETPEGERFRYVKLVTNGSTAGERPHDIEYLVPVHAFGNSYASFYSIPKGSYVVIRGWIETRPNIGVVVISENEDLFPIRKEKK